MTRYRESAKERYLRKHKEYVMAKVRTIVQILAWLTVLILNIYLLVS